MAHDARAGVIGQHAGNALGGFVRALAHDDHAGMLREAHAHAAAMVQRHPRRAAGGIEQGVQQRPVGLCV
ncbi:hypothetical protein G6F54_014526 [Rhizopus delemar]|nr:hypothetical protein G6F54_014526 [Rhizopus delemar]